VKVAVKICVIGLGYIGLPTAIVFANNGSVVHGVDSNRNVVNTLNSLELHLHEPGLKEAMTEAIHRGNLTFSTQPESADAYIISVQTPLESDHSPNLNYVKAAAVSLLPYLKKGDLIVLESTVPPGTVEDVMLPILHQTNLRIGEDLWVAHSPERVLPGHILKELVANDRIIGGINEMSTHMAVQLYSRFVKGIIHTTDVRTAEMVKLMENTYRDVNIAYANELARIAETVGFNVWDAIRLANSHPRVHIHQPGPGVGGHCIAVDPWFIVDRAPQQAQLIALARTINNATPSHIVRMIESVVSHLDKPIITLLGLSFKGNIDDWRGSPSLAVNERLQEKGYSLRLFDPYVQHEIRGKVSSLSEAVDGSDCIIVLTDHAVFKEIDWATLKQRMRNVNILDTRNLLNLEHLTELGYCCYRIGSSFKH
ncbi:MAG: UDP-N-acetyl-D-mannosamine dehydrogenase, partial [Paenibacillus sp.]|nr:UDP-N-acetyl-D-mannosamine dehydrogenase [Paenibacillus sp.]